jgi:DNA-binding transcriptional MocR family regulator
MPATPTPLVLCTQPPAELPAAPLYQQIAQLLAQLIHSGTFKTGQRLPSVRDTAAQQGVSVSTVMQAFRLLEERGLVQARPKAGYFVRRMPRIAQPRPSTPPARSFSLEKQSRSDAFAVLYQPGDWACFGGFTPQSGALFDDERLRVAIGRASRVHRRSLTEYNRADAGTLALRQAVARRVLHMGCALDASDIVITASCVQAVSLCLRAVTVPGDVVALESPTFFGYLDLLESLGLRALEIPTHPRTGLSLPALELALDTQPVKAVLSTPTLSNPLGSVMPQSAKQRLVRLLAERGVPLIEDAVFNDLMAGDERRKAAKAFDTDGGVMLCGSFSKTLTPGLRLGWVAAGRWRAPIATQKRLQGACTNVVMEEALADLLTQGSYEAQLRRLSSQLRERTREARQLVACHFPHGTRVSDPPSGYNLWIELPPSIDSMVLFQRCVARGITFGPGALFSATGRYSNCLRLSFSGPWGQKEASALEHMGTVAHTLLTRPTVAPQTPLEQPQGDPAERLRA